MCLPMTEQYSKMFEEKKYKNKFKIYPVEVNSLEIVVGVANNNRHFFAHSCQMNFTRDGKVGTPAPFLGTINSTKAYLVQ